MSSWPHLFSGEFTGRNRTLAGLKREQVALRQLMNAWHP